MCQIVNVCVYILRECACCSNSAGCILMFVLFFISVEYISCFCLWALELKQLPDGGTSVKLCRSVLLRHRYPLAQRKRHDAFILMMSCLVDFSMFACSLWKSCCLTHSTQLFSVIPAPPLLVKSTLYFSSGDAVATKHLFLHGFYF